MNTEDRQDEGMRGGGGGHEVKTDEEKRKYTLPSSVVKEEEDEEEKEEEEEEGAARSPAAPPARAHAPGRHIACPWLLLLRRPPARGCFLFVRAAGATQVGVARW